MRQSIKHDKVFVALYRNIASFPSTKYTSTSFDTCVWQNKA